MAIITMIFPVPLNVSIQPTDVMYVCLTDDFGQAGVNTPNPTQDTKPFPMGVVDTVNHVTGVVKVDDNGYSYPTLTNAHYYFFSKDRRANMSGILGHYAEVEYRNYSQKQAEIFATGTDFSVSSK
jgi:hypothetical protein